MIRNTFNTDFGNVAGLLASDTPLTTAEVTALHDEIASDPAVRGYAGQTASQVLSLGAAGYFTANPASAGRVSRGILPSGQFYGDMVQYGMTVAAVLLPDSAAVPTGVPAQYTPIAVKQLISDVPKTDTVNTASPSVQALINIAVAYGLVIASVADGLLTNPDPNYQAQVYNESRWAFLFAGGCPTLAEVATAKG